MASFNQQGRRSQNILRIGAATFAGLTLAELPADAFAQTATQLDEISVQGAVGGRGTGIPVDPAARGIPRDAGAGPGGGESPKGPIDGYVARRSATGGKTDTPLVETPQSITVIGKQQIEAQQVQSVSDALKYAAGVYGGPYGPDPRFDFFLIRGFTANDTGLYKDGLQLFNYGFGGYQVDPYALERIEVLRGPAAVLYGQGGPGGLINLVSKRPPLLPFNSVEVGGGSFGQKYAAFDFGGPADSEGRWFYRLTGIGRQGGTQVDGTEANRGYIAPSFTYRPDGATSLTILSSFQYDDTGRVNSFLPYAGTVRPQALGLFIPRNFNVNDTVNNRYERTQAYIGYEFETHLNETFTVRQNARYAFSDASDDSFGAGIGYVDPSQTQLGRYRFRATSRSRLFNVDNQLEARFDDGLFRHTMLFGLDYKHYQLNDNQAIGFGIAPFNILQPNYGSPSVPAGSYLVNYDIFQQLGLYAQDQIKLTDALTLVVSGRGDLTTNEVNDKLNPANSTAQGSRAITERFGLIYNFDFGLAPYVSYATFFNPIVGTDVFSNPRRPVTGDQYEVGVKYQPPGYDLFATFAAFDLTLANTLTADPTNPNNQVQLGETRSRGVEFQVVANLTPDWNLVGSVTKYDLDVVRGTAAQIGRTPTNTPEFFGSIFTDYTIPTGPFAGLGFGSGVRYVGRSFVNIDNSLTVPDFTLFDAVVHYQHNGWRFAVNASNIADKRFVASCQSEFACFYGEARRIIASMNYKW